MAWRAGAKVHACAPARRSGAERFLFFLFLFIVHASAPLSRARACACGVRNPSLFFHCLSRGAHGGRERLQLGHVPLLVSLFSLALELARWTDRTHAPRSPMHTTTTRSSHGAGRFNIPRTTAAAAAVAPVIRAAPRVRAVVEEVVEADAVRAAVPTAGAWSRW